MDTGPAGDVHTAEGRHLFEESFRLFVESVLDYAIFMLDPGGHVLTWNKGAEQIKGYRPEEIIGRHFSTFYPPEDIAAKKPERELAEALEKGRVEDEGWRIRKDGSRFWANVVITALRDHQGRLYGFGKVTRDLTARRAGEEERRRLAEETALRTAAEKSNRRLAFLADVGAALASATEVEECLRMLSRRVIPYLGDWASVAFREPGQPFRRVAAHSDPAKAALLAEYERSFPAEAHRIDSGFTTALEKGKAVLIPRVDGATLAGQSQNPAHERLLRELGVHSCLMVPLTVRGRLLGILSVMTSSSQRTLGDEELSMAEHVAHRASLLLDNLRLLEGEQAARGRAELERDRLARLLRLSAALGQAQAASEVASILLKEAMGDLEGAVGAVYLREDHHLRRLETLGATSRLPLAEERLPLEGEKSATSQAVVNAEPLFLTLEEHATRWPNLSTRLKAEDLAGLAVVPLTAGERVLGALSIGHRIARSLTDGERELFRAMGRQAGIALDRIRLQEESAVDERRYRFLSETSALLAGSLEVQETLARVARMAVPAIADWAAVELVERDGTRTLVEAAHQDPAKVALALELRRRYPPDPVRDPGWAKLKGGESILMPEIDPKLIRASARNEEHLRLLEALQIRSAIAVPMRVRGETVGVITLICAESWRRYGAEDLTLAEELARRASAALENARLYDAEQRARQEAEKSAARVLMEQEAKDRFINLLSHELRNPLAAVRNALELWKVTGKPSDRVREILERQVGHLARMTDDLLDVSRTISGKIRLENAPLDLGTLVERLVEDLRPSFESAGVALRLKLPRERLIVAGDETRLAQVVGNLVQNARKFTDPGGRVAVTLSRRDPHAVLTVEDTGVGIEPGFLPEIFTPFVQADRTLARSQGGLGLGLALVKSLVGLHGGQVSARSEGPGKGAVFEVRIPLAPRSVVVLARPEPSAPRVRSRGKAAGRRVLVIEDNADLAGLQADLLERDGYRVKVAEEPLKGIELARRWKPEVVLCDLGLPGIDGYEVARRLKADRKTADIRLLAISGYGTEADRARSLAAGFDEHLTKPVDPERLRQTISAAPKAG